MAEQKSMTDETPEKQKAGVKKKKTTSSKKNYTDQEFERVVELKADELFRAKLVEMGLEDGNALEEFNKWRGDSKRMAETLEGERGEFEKKIAHMEQEHRAELVKEREDKQSWKQKYEAYKKRAVITEAAMKAGADPENVDMIVSFTEGYIAIGDDESTRITAEDGGPRLDPETGKEMSIAAYMREFLNNRPGLARATESRGAGTGSVKSKNGIYTLEDIKQIAKTDPKRYAELKKEGVVDTLYNRHLYGG